MPEARVIEWIRQKFVNIAQDLDERGRRRWAASEALSLGRGGITAVAAATGISDRTIRNGIRELNDPNPLPPDRQRGRAEVAHRRATWIGGSPRKTGGTGFPWGPPVPFAMDLQEHSILGACASGGWL